MLIMLQVIQIQYFIKSLQKLCKVHIIIPIYYLQMKAGSSLVSSSTAEVTGLHIWLTLSLCSFHSFSV